MTGIKIIWSKQASNSLKHIYEYYKERSPQGAKKVRAELLNAPKKIVFSQQYQQDEINPKYRRIIVRDYKVLYLEKDNIISVIDIISTKQSPDLLKEM